MLVTIITHLIMYLSVLLYSKIVAKGEHTG
jgi:hypothetical protein